MNLQTKSKTFESIAEIKDFIKSKTKAINNDVNEIQSFVQEAFGEFPKDTLALIELIEKVIEYKETEKK